MLELLHRSSCADCGIDDVLVLEFDHTGPKRAAVGTLLRSHCSPPRLEREIANCEIVCASCHRRRTAIRAGWFRATRRPPATWPPTQIRNHRYLLGVLERSGCVDCGLADPVVLDFDHRGDKRGNVSTMASWASLDTLSAEVAKCDVRCVNCHRRKTLRAIGSYRVAAVQSESPP